jgi:hypothetical protein
MLLVCQGVCSKELANYKHLESSCVLKWLYPHLQMFAHDWTTKPYLKSDQTTEKDAFQFHIFIYLYNDALSITQAA